jgi:transcriptional regulator with XRE-family HTH domain
MSVSQISLIENGLRNPSAKSLKALANALEVGIEDLYSAEAPKKASGASVAVTGRAEPRIHWADIERWMREEGVEARVIERVRERVLTAFIGD